MIDLIKKVKKENNMEIGDVVAGFCEWGEVHYFELKRTDEWLCLEPTYTLYIEEQGHDFKRFAINFTGTADDILTTLEAIDNIYVVEEEEEE